MVSFYTIRNELGRSHKLGKPLTSLTFSQKSCLPDLYSHPGVREKVLTER